MKRTSRWIGIAALGLIGLSACGASAASITYTVTDFASGALGGTPYTDVLVTITAIADTNNITPAPGQPGVLYVQDTSASINIAGLGSAEFTTPTLFLVDQNPTARGSPPTPAVIFGWGTPTNPGIVIIALSNPAFASYNLTALGAPLSGPPIGAGDGEYTFTTSAGLVSIDWLAAAAFQATLQTATVPEPASLVVLSLGLAAVAALAWRRHSAA